MLENRFSEKRKSLYYCLLEETYRHLPLKDSNQTGKTFFHKMVQHMKEDIFK